MTDTIETLKAAAAELTARVAAFEKARVEEEEPPALTEAQMYSLNKGTASASTDIAAARYIRYCERELALLRDNYEALKQEYNDFSALAHNYCKEFGVGRLGYSMIGEVILDARRLREGLKRLPGDATDEQVAHYSTPGIYCVDIERMAREIQRHRALLKDGGGE